MLETKIKIKINFYSLKVDRVIRGDKPLFEIILCLRQILKSGFSLNF